MLSSKPRCAPRFPLKLRLAARACIQPHILGVAPVLLAVALAGCTPQSAAPEKAASTPAPAASAAVQPASAPASAPALTAEEQAVKQRAQARWDALVAGDYKSAWTYLEPGKRKELKQEDYESSFGSDASWTKATVLNARCIPGRCAAFVRLTMQTRMQGMGQKLVEVTNHFDEEWVQDEGQWWYRDVYAGRPKEGEASLPSAAVAKPRRTPPEFGGVRRTRSSAASSAGQQR